MSRLPRSLRQMLTIARRDFIATVFTPIFLLFLFAPALMGSLSALGGMSAAAMDDSAADKSRIVAIVAPATAEVMRREDVRLRALYRRDDTPSDLVIQSPGRDPAVQARALMADRTRDIDAVLYGPLDRPQLLLAPRNRRTGDYMDALAQATLAAERLGGTLPRVVATRTVVERQRTSIGGQHQAGFFAVFGIFFLTLFLASQVVGTMAEERNNKVIEVLAAAVPLEAVFGGKLIGMFGVALLFVGFWGTIVTQVASLLPPAAAGALGDIAPAIGGPAFALLFAAYFSMAYLLLGSVFLGLGAQASTPREIQMLSLPITLIQVGMFVLASAAARRPDSWVATVAEIFPLSSPFAMAGRAANAPEVWPHLLALPWQMLWVVLFVTIGARLFRRGVLQSGSATPFWRRGRRGSTAR
jgi:ABC-2 type transport system permease protein